MKVSYEVLSDVKNIYDGSALQSIQFLAQFIFTELSKDERKLLGFPDETDMKNYVMTIDGNIPPFTKEVEIKSEIVSRLEAIKTQYVNRVSTLAPVKATVMADTNFKIKLTTKEEVTSANP